MSNNTHSDKTPSFLFHVPMTGKTIDYNQLKQKMTTRHPPAKVEVIESSTCKIIGKMPPSAALAKFR